MRQKKKKDELCIGSISLVTYFLVVDRSGGAEDGDRAKGCPGQPFELHDVKLVQSTVP